jgi:hypothetical protein
MTEVGKITAEMLLPEMVERYPSTRAVLDRYGLHGCGGPKGPREQIDWFARLHGVPIEKLLHELNEAASNPTAAPAFEPSIADTIYRPFFLAGIATVLTLACVWGAINLLTIGRRQSFSAVAYSWVLAHGHAMVFGFVGFFIMGFAYQAFPRFKHTTLWRPYDLRHTFATRLLERGVHHFVISALLGHATPMMGFGAASRMTPGYAHATWETMVMAVAMLEQPLEPKQISFAVAGSMPKSDQGRKVG